jgi:hypothetical protein
MSELRCDIIHCDTARERELATRIEREVRELRNTPVTLTEVHRRVRHMLPEMTRPENVRPYSAVLVERTGLTSRVDVMKRDRLCLMIHRMP